MTRVHEIYGTLVTKKIAGCSSQAIFTSGVVVVEPPIALESCVAERVSRALQRALGVYPEVQIQFIYIYIHIYITLVMGVYIPSYKVSNQA